MITLFKRIKHTVYEIIYRLICLLLPPTLVVERTKYSR